MVRLLKCLYLFYVELILQYFEAKEHSSVWEQCKFLSTMVFCTRSSGLIKKKFVNQHLHFEKSVIEKKMRR